MTWLHHQKSPSEAADVRNKLILVCGKFELRTHFFQVFFVFLFDVKISKSG